MDKKQRRDELFELKQEEIVRAVKRGEWKPSDVIKIFLHEAYKILEYNCLTYIISRALNDAQTLDDIANYDDMKLCWLPVSLEDNIATKGMRCTLGLTSLMDQPAEVDDGVIVKVLRHCGAVPILKTNISQQMISFTSSNPVHGEVLHPARAEFAPGGSSSGEGPMLAFRYSALGIGADLIGGLRVPAHLCGTAALKPTVNRLSVTGLKGTRPGGLILRATIGPMANNVDTLEMAMQALLCPLMFELDPNVPPIPFNEEIFNSTKKLRIGYYIDDGYNKPITAIRKGVLLAKKTLENAGHVLVQVKVPKIEEAMEIITAALFSDGGQIYLDELRGSLEEPRLGNLYSKLRCPYAIRKIKTYLLGLKACKDSVGMRVRVQCVAQPWQKELCLRVMREIQNRPL